MTQPRGVPSLRFLAAQALGQIQIPPHTLPDDLLEFFHNVAYIEANLPTDRQYRVDLLTEGLNLLQELQNLPDEAAGEDLDRIATAVDDLARRAAEFHQRTGDMCEWLGALGEAGLTRAFESYFDITASMFLLIESLTEIAEVIGHSRADV